MPTYMRVDAKLYDQVRVALINAGQHDLVGTLTEDSQPILNCMSWVEEDADMAAGRAIEEGLLTEAQRQEVVTAAIEGYDNEYAIETVNVELDEFIAYWAEDQKRVLK